MSGAFEDMRFAEQYPQQDVADNEVLMAFRNDEDGIAFREWWHEKGKIAFADWLKRRRKQ